MNANMESTGADDTRRIAEELGGRLRGGEVIDLVSDLGGGKTTFVQGLARGIGSADKVASPTFTVSRLYKGKDLELHHFDFYRLADAGLMEHELHDIINDPEVVVVVEWGDIVDHVLPPGRLTIRMTRTGDDSRLIEMSCPDASDYLLKGLK